MTNRFATTGAAALSASLIAAGLVAGPVSASTDEPPALELVGRYVAERTPAPLEGEDDVRAEVTAALGDRMYVVNHTALDIVDIRTPDAPVLLGQVSLAGFGGSITSVATTAGLVAVSIPATEKTQPGTVVLLTPTGRILRSVTVGANPDMLTFDADGRRLVVANEGEPSGYGVGYSDPAGSVSIIDVRRLLTFRRGAVRTAGFTDFNVGGKRTLDPAVRIFGPGASVAQDLEPEYVTIRGNRAFVTMQENNAIAEVHLGSGRVQAVRPLALKNHSQPGNGLDASDRDPRDASSINIATWPVLGMPMPDGIASFRHRGTTYLITANEGDARDWPGLAEEVRVGSASYTLDPTAFPNAADLKREGNLGRLTVTNQGGDTDGDGDFDEIRAFGTRSVSIWTADGRLVWDSGDQIENAVRAVLPEDFNSTNDENDSFDTRSDNKGPEPEGVTVGEVGGRRMVYVGLERVGGLVAFDITNPTGPVLVEYVNSRDFTLNPTDGSTDSGPEALTFVPAGDSPSGRPLIVVSNEVSGTVSLWSPAEE